ncbi:hypothetical protein [Kitasatospora sp. NPDC059327]|uniref:hypothetical protein n=1 Tax=Kitasatospora sp. NPDC059327 TaxID=3346803 RepID=UPI0036C45725
MDEGGEPACWLDLVCPECGRVRERLGPWTCANCDAPPEPGTPPEPGVAAGARPDATTGTNGDPGADRFD